MFGQSSTTRTIIIFVLFISLQVLAVLMISKTSIVQRVRVASLAGNIHAELLDVSEQMLDYIRLRDNNNELLSQNMMLMKRVAERGDTTVRDTQYNYYPARVISNSINKKSNFIIIDKGRRDGIEPDMGVITPLGVVGVVKAVSDKYSLVISLLNIDNSVNISAKLSKSNAFGPLMWDGVETDRIRLTDIPFHIKYEIGDTVATSGYSSIFPADIPIGTAMENKIKMGTYQDIQVRLFQDFSKLRYVYIVKNSDKEEILNLIKSGSYHK